MAKKIDFTKNIINFDQIDSTNDYLKTNYHNLANYTVVRANYQTNGHGQFKRVWEANKNENLLCSILIKKHLPFDKDDVNPIIVSTLLSLLYNLNINAHFKYPNDIYVENKKIAGILIETKYDEKALEYMVIGIGLNVNQEAFLNENAISIKQIVKRDFDINDILFQLLNHFGEIIFLRNLMNLGEVNEHKKND